MQWVETDGTPIRIVDRVSQQVIDIGDHGRNHDHRRVAPTATVERERDKQRGYEVQSDVYHFCVGASEGGITNDYEDSEYLFNPYDVLDF